MIETTVSETIIETIIVSEDTEPSVLIISTDEPQVIIAENEPGPQGIQGPAGESGLVPLSQLEDVDVSNLTNGSLLVYSDQSSTWVATTLLENQRIESGQY
jgi:hypothetical protein